MANYRTAPPENFAPLPWSNEVHSHRGDTAPASLGETTATAELNFLAIGKIATDA